MKIRTALFALSALLAVPGIRAADQQPPAKPAHDHEHTELGDHMEEMGRAFRRLSRQIGDATKNDDSLKQAETIRKNADACLTLKPAKLADVPEAQQAQFLTDYQAEMKRLLGDVDKLEQALKAGDNKTAADVVRSMKKDQSDGHKQFQKKKKHDDM